MSQKIKEHFSWQNDKNSIRSQEASQQKIISGSSKNDSRADSSKMLYNYLNDISECGTPEAAKKVKPNFWQPSEKNDSSIFYELAKQVNGKRQGKYNWLGVNGIWEEIPYFLTFVSKI